MKRFGTALTISALLWGCGGGGGEPTEEAVRQAVIEHLSGRAALDVGSMDIEVTSVTSQGDEIAATVSFRPKGQADPAAGMQMQYTLEQKGNHWVVKGKSGAAGSPHGGAMPPPEGGSQNPHGGGTPPSGGAMPPGHPPVTPPTESPTGATE